MAISIGMKPSVVLDYLEPCIGNNINMKRALLNIILYACLEAFNVKGSILRFFSSSTKGIIKLWVYDDIMKNNIFGPLNSKICAMGC